MCNKAVDNYAHALNLSLIATRLKKCVMKPSTLILLQHDLFLNPLRLKVYVTKLLMLVILYFILLSIDIRLKKCVTIVSEDLFMLIYCPENYKIQAMCEEVVDDYLVALKFVPHWFVTSKMLRKFHDSLLANDDIVFLDKDFNKFTYFANE